MRHTTTFLVTVLLLALVGSSAASAGTPRELTGTYDWSDGGSDELRATFRPDADGTWTVRFEFRFGGKTHSWTGAAEGSLDDGGTITGTAGWKGRRWTFDGAVIDGVLRGSHSEIKRKGRRYDTGTFELTRATEMP